MSTIADSLKMVVTQIDEASTRAGRGQKEIILVAVSKKHTSESMKIYVDAAKTRGIRVVFGENYVQELRQKRECFGDTAEFHLIGPLQSNKVKEAVKLSDVIQSAHSTKIIQLIAKESRALAKRQRIFIQVNIGSDLNKSGFSPDQISDVLGVVSANNDALLVEGLMTITPFYDIPEDARKDFKALNNLRAQLYSSGANKLFYDEKIALSMGMSADFNIAIEEGADLVRVGTAIFGER
jgi:pyridoxal phosphate enzyme (YggS family)